MSMSKGCAPVFLKYQREEMRVRGMLQQAEVLFPAADKPNYYGRGIMPLLLYFFILFILFVNSEFAFAAISQKEIDREVAAGRRVADNIEKEFELLSDPAQVVRLVTILERLTNTLDVNYPWQVKIIRREELNAFCLPGGFIYFFTGLVDKLRSDSELAAVMAHEIAHVTERHAMKQSARSSKLTIANLVLILATGGAAAPAIAAQLASIAVMNSYSLEYEQEADVKGTKMLIEAGYSPAAVVTVMETFMAEEIKTPLFNYGIYMSHPESRKRVEYLAKYLRDNMIQLNRKEALLALRSSIRSENGKVFLKVDDVEVWNGPDNEEVHKAIERAKRVIDLSLQMELAPYDIAVDGGFLRIKNTVAAEEPLMEGMPPLSSVREKLLEAVLAAQRKHPIAKYFR